MRVIFIFFSTLILILSGCITPTAIVAPRQEQKKPLAEEVKSGLPERLILHERTGFYYAFDYDDNNIYLELATSDQDVKRKIAYFGFTVWIDRTGAKNEDQGFRFPTGIRMPMDIIQEGRPQGSAAVPGGWDMNSILERADKIDLIGIYGSSVRTVKTRDSRIRVKAEIIDDLLVYDAVVPFEVLKFGYNPLSGENRIGIGFETGYFEPPSSSGRQRPSQQGGIRPGGGMTGQYPRQYPINERVPVESGSADTGRLSRPTSLWIILEFTQ